MVQWYGNVPTSVKVRDAVPDEKSPMFETPAASGESKTMKCAPETSWNFTLAFLEIVMSTGLKLTA